MHQWLRQVLRRRSQPEPQAATIDHWLREAYALHRSGNVADAEDRYRWILREQPHNVDALFLLGEIANRTGRHERAIELLGKAIAANAGVAAFHRELASALRAKGDLGAAENCLVKALELDPGDLQTQVDIGLAQLDQRKSLAGEQTFRSLLGQRPDLLVAQVNLGAALAAQRRYDEASACYHAALRLDPLCAQALSNLASLSIKRGDLAEGQRLVQRALEIDPLCFEALINLSTVLLKQRRYDSALQILEDSVRAQPGRAEVHANLGKVHGFLGNHAAAIESLTNALRLDPASVDAHLEMGNALYTTGRIDDALQHLRIAANLDPGLAVVHVDLGHVLDTAGEPEQALACYERAIALAPDDVQAHVNRAAIWLRSGDFARGWAEYEWRLRSKTLAAYYERFAIPRWDGSSLAGRTLLIYSEQGIGDEIMYASCFAELVEQAGHCVIECAAKLEPLFQRNFARATVRAETKHDPAGWLKNVPCCDVAIPAASLPLYLRRTAAEFPRERAYLVAEQQRVERWRSRLAELGSGLKVGLSWRGGVPETGTRLRSIPLERWLPILRQPHLHFVSLQYGDCQGDLDRLQRLHGIRPMHFQEAIDDYEETSALVCALDLTISVCTAVVHLGGAQARPVWVMAPVRPEARYGHKGESMPWYASVRMFRQSTFGDWDSVVAKVAQELAAFAHKAA